MVIGCGDKGTLDPRQFLFLDLSHLFEKVLRVWGPYPVRHSGEPGPDPHYLPMEKMVTLSGALNGFLVVRSTREFALRLRDSRENTPLGRYPEEEVFEELVSLFCLYLFHAFWKPHLFHMGPIHPFPSIPRDWPEGPPTLSCALQADGHPVEIRLWARRISNDG